MYITENIEFVITELTIKMLKPAVVAWVVQAFGNNTDHLRPVVRISVQCGVSIVQKRKLFGAICIAERRAFEFMIHAQMLAEDDDKEATLIGPDGNL